jgi:hypothetical protein
MANASQSEEKSHAIGLNSTGEMNQVGANNRLFDEYFQAVEKKRRALPNLRGNDAIRALLRQNVFRTRAMLYKDYMNYRQMDASAYQSQIQLHIDQYSKPDNLITLAKLTMTSASRTKI